MVQTKNKIRWTLMDLEDAIDKINERSPCLVASHGYDEIKRKAWTLLRLARGTWGDSYYFRQEEINEAMEVIQGIGRRRGVEIDITFAER